METNKKNHGKDETKNVKSGNQTKNSSSTSQKTSKSKEQEERERMQNQRGSSGTSSKYEDQELSEDGVEETDEDETSTGKHSKTKGKK